jgi:hypothetical protein
MSTVKEIESALSKLTFEEMEQVREWLDDLIEDQMEVRPEFKARIEQARQDIANGIISRVRRPGNPA